MIAENLLIIDDKKLAERYVKNWRSMRGIQRFILVQHVGYKYSLELFYFKGEFYGDGFRKRVKRLKAKGNYISAILWLRGRISRVFSVGKKSGKGRFI